MRSRLFASSLVALATVVMLAPSLRAQTSDPYADGLRPGDYLRISGGMITPVNAQGGLKDWDRGKTIALAWESWQPNSGGNSVGNFGFAVTADYSRLPLNAPQFVSEFTPASGGTTTGATASSATAFSIGTNLRYRFPAPFIMPSIEFGFGYLDFNPSTVHYTSTTGNGNATQRHRRGAALSFGAGLDKQVVDKLGIFGEAMYTYGFTSLGYGFATPGGTCASQTCDVLKNTTLGVIRGGVRVQMGR
jgi:hypothetical protein